MAILTVKIFFETSVLPGSSVSWGDLTGVSDPGDLIVITASAQSSPAAFGSFKWVAMAGWENGWFPTTADVGIWYKFADGTETSVTPTLFSGSTYLESQVYVWSVDSTYTFDSVNSGIAYQGTQNTGSGPRSVNISDVAPGVAGETAVRFQVAYATGVGTVWPVGIGLSNDMLTAVQEGGFGDPGSGDARNANELELYLDEYPDGYNPPATTSESLSELFGGTLAGNTVVVWNSVLFFTPPAALAPRGLEKPEARVRIQELPYLIRPHMVGADDSVLE